MPRKRTVAAVLILGAALGVAVGALDRARGVPSSADRIFLHSPADRLISLPVGDNDRRPGSLHAGAAINPGAAS